MGHHLFIHCEQWFCCFASYYSMSWLSFKVCLNNVIVFKTVVKHDTAVFLMSMIYRSPRLFMCGS